MSQFQNNNNNIISNNNNSDECQSMGGDVDPYYETTMETLYSYHNDSEHSGTASKLNLNFLNYYTPFIRFLFNLMKQLKIFKKINLF